MSISLPIDPLKPRFLELLNSHHLVVESQTGSGKSTRLPLWASETGRVLVVEPRRVACLALSDYLSSQKGPKVGHAIRFESTVDEQTRIAFVTPGIALRWLNEDGLMGYDTVIIDEFHERRWDTDLLLALLKQRHQHRLVLTSATIDGERLARYLEGERLIGEGRQFDVSIHYLAKESRQLPDERGLESRVRDAVLRGMTESPGDILVFLPGKREISQCAAQLKGLDVQTVPLHGGATNAEQREALRRGKGRRVILATNVAETSLTIPGITCVIDSGLERRTHQRNGRTVLGLHRISLASAAQRAGRAGRIQAGSCYRLWGQHAPMELLTPPEIKREELVEPMLAAACSGVRLDELTFVDSLPEKSLGIAKEKLIQMQAIDAEGRATAHGRRLYPLPIDTLFAHLITAMEEKACREAMVDLAAALSLGSRLWQPPSSEDGIKVLKAWQPMECDAMTLLSLLRQRLPDEILCDKQMLADARMLANQIRNALELPQLSASTPVSRKAWLEAVMKAQPDLVYVRRLKRTQALGNGYSEVQQGRDSRVSEEALGAVVFDQFSLPGRGVKQTLNLATCMAPVTFNQILEAGLGELQTGELQEDGHTLISKVVYAGRELGERTHQGSEEQVVATLVREILLSQRLTGTAKELKQDLAAWALWCALGEGEGETPTPEAWLTRRLTELGVESFDDMALIEQEELAFEGIPQWQRAEFDERFPQHLILAELKLTVEYDIRKKSIDVVYQSGTRKGGPKRWELPRWAGWRVFYRKASKRVSLT